MKNKFLLFSLFVSVSGFPVEKPLFMETDKKKLQQPEESSESDAEWTPALERKKRKKTKGKGK